MSLHRLLYPRSVAIVGASDKVGPGFNARAALQAVGFQGEVHFVNPGRDSLFGQPCHKTLAAVPGTVDAVFVAVQQNQVIDVMHQAIEKGAGGLAILSSGFGEAGAEGLSRQAELKRLADEHGIAVCGPNCLGFLNFAGKTALFGTSLPDRPQRGGVAAIVQSGSIGIALLNAARHLGLSHLVTSGNEAVTTVADYMDLLIDDPDVRVFAIFLEQLRHPQKFIAGCRRARAAGKPVIVLKSGRTASGQKAVMAHTGAVAGSVEVCDAAFREAGAIQVSSLDELIETAMVFSAVPGPLKGRGAAMLSLSGGEIALALDAGEQARLAFPPVTTARDALTELLPPYSTIANPLDLTWVGLYDASVARRCARALGEQADIGLIVLLQDSPRGLGAQQANRYATLLGSVAEGAAEAGVPLVALSNISGDLHPDYEAMALRHNVPCLRGTVEGATAIARRLAWSNAQATASVPAPSEDAHAAARAALTASGSRVLAEHDSRRVLAAYGVPALREHATTTAAAATRAARDIGFPVVMKAIVPEIVHKSDLGLVHLNIRDEAEALDVAEDLLAQIRTLGDRDGSSLLVQEMISPVAELLVGARVDPEFGPVVVAGSGGVQVELFKDVAIRLAPVTPETAAEMIRETKVGQTLDGWRGRPKGDLEAAAAVVSAVSRFIADHQDQVREVEINPLAVLAEGQGCRPLDCVIVRATT
ncbi:MAG TPA: acetate--CoA ligase family protein [Azospirillum sp.]|nr:acetate--CoA ligase family protein [Azospirillum sp.]